MSNQPLVVIMGPTASGKSSLAMKLAERFGGEIISADSRAIYKDLDIGTAKPSPADQALVPHWGIDLVEPGDRFTAADFKQYAEQKIDEIRRRGKLPFLVGGSGMYVDAVVLDYSFSGGFDQSSRDKFAAMTTEELHEYCVKNNITIPENDQNKRYLIRAIERNNVVGNKRESPIENCIIVGITTDRQVLRQRIEERAADLFDRGMVEESIAAGAKYGWDNEAMTGNIYKLVRQYTAGEIDYRQLVSSFITLDWRLAKRQLTWMKRNKFINWLSLDEAELYLNRQLASEQEM